VTPLLFSLAMLINTLSYRVSHLRGVAFNVLKNNTLSLDYHPTFNLILTPYWVCIQKNDDDCKLTNAKWCTNN
jgi:hypothetical protein